MPHYPLIAFVAPGRLVQARCKAPLSIHARGRQAIGKGLVQPLEVADAEAAQGGALHWQAAEPKKCE